MTWAESDRLTWDEREALMELINMGKQQGSAPPRAEPASAVERLTARAGL